MGVIIAQADFDAVVFDMDGVVTDTARVHRAAWRRTFDELVPDEAPFTDGDYLRHVDGRARVDGVTSFLASRGIELPLGSPEDLPGHRTAWAVANAKDAHFQAVLASDGASPFPTSLALVRRLRDCGMATAVVTASRNREAVLRAAGAEGLFDAAVDGNVAAALSLPGKPDPALFLEAARRLGVAPGRAVVVEDALAGVEAGRRGGFGLVVGVARVGEGDGAALLDRGAHVVVHDLGEVSVAADEWHLRRHSYAPEAQGHYEALCTLGNGVIGTRGATADAGPSPPGAPHYPGTYAAGLFNRLTSEIHGRTLEHESLVNLPNWLPLRLRTCDSGWLDPASPPEFEESLDMRHGELRRTTRLRDAQGRHTTIDERRFVSMRDANLAAISLTVTPEDWSGELTIRSAIDGDVQNRNVSDELELAGRHLRVVETGESSDDVVWLAAETVQSHRRVGIAARTRVAAVPSRRALHATPTLVAHDVTVAVRAGEPVVIEKVASLYSSLDPAISEPALAAREHAAAARDYEALFARHALAWDHLWQRCGLRLDGDDPQTARALNLHIFHVLQTLSPNVVDRDVGVPARGLHGEGYRGHVFWDELFVFPFLNLRLPDLTRELLLYRYRRLGAARQAAAAIGRKGAMYPWQSGSDGREETPSEFFNARSGRWMKDNSRRQRHVNLAIAYNVWHYHEVSGDSKFLASVGGEMLFEIARFFADLAEYDRSDGRYHLRRVMGPDEFHDGYPDRPGEGIDDNAYTNVMVSWLLQRALDADNLLDDHRGDELRQRIGLKPEETALWHQVSRRLHVPFLPTGLLEQFAGYRDLDEFDWAGYRATYGNIGRLDLILEAEGDSTNRYQLSKQADALMLFYLFSAEELCELFDHLGLPFNPASIPATIDYYVARSSDGSTLSRVAHAWVLSRSDRPRSWKLFQEAVASDLDDIQAGTTKEGIHLGAMAGTIDLVQRCYTGIEVRHGVLWLNPRLPHELTNFEFSIGYRGHRLDIAVTPVRVQITSRRSVAPPVNIGLGSEIVQLATGHSTDFELPR